MVTQGRHVNPATGCCKEWTTKYTVHYSADGRNWETVKDNNIDKVGLNGLNYFLAYQQKTTLLLSWVVCPLKESFMIFPSWISGSMLVWFSLVKTYISYININV